MTRLKLPSVDPSDSRRVSLVLSALVASVFVAGPVLARDVNLDHRGDDRCFNISQSSSGSTDLYSRGDGGCLDAQMNGTGQTDLNMLGDNVRGRLVDESSGGSVFMGMCPPGMQLEPVDRSPDTFGVSIPRCI